MCGYLTVLFQNVSKSTLGTAFTKKGLLICKLLYNTPTRIVGLFFISAWLIACHPEAVQQNAQATAVQTTTGAAAADELPSGQYVASTEPTDPIEPRGSVNEPPDPPQPLIATNQPVVATPRPPFPSGPNQAMRPITVANILPELTDDLPLEPLLKAVEAEIQMLEKSRRHSTFSFGNRVLTKSEYIQGLKRFLEIGKHASSEQEFLESIKSEFDFYEVYGPPEGDWSEAKITAYYEPVIPGSLKKTKKFSQALYRRPSDLIHARVRLSQKQPKHCKKESNPQDCQLKDKYVARARYQKRKNRWVLVPYYSRKQIDEKGALRRRHLELCWVDPLDAYFLQIEGSGTILIDGNKPFRVRVSDQNGHPNRKSPSLYAQAKLHGTSIEQYLRGLPIRKMKTILHENPSYVFFEQNTDGVNTSLGMEATAGRTIATDARFFPKGALAFLIAKKPKFANPEDETPTEWEPLARFVLDQDTGGAIRGGGRVDLFVGTGKEAKKHADMINQLGHLYYLVPKSSSTDTEEQKIP